MLYGTTTQGGAYSYGVLFQYNISTATYVDKFDFANGNGSSPLASLMQASDGMLYGITNQGGANCYGVLFQYNTSSSTYIDKFDFAGTSGGSPNGSLIQAADGMFYGMTSQGGTNNIGVIYQYNPSSSTYLDKLDFALAANGRYPGGDLFQASDGWLYGMAQYGGTSTTCPFGCGTLFKYGTTAGITENNSEAKYTIFPNPASNILTLNDFSTNPLETISLKMYDIVGNLVFIKLNANSNQLSFDVSQLAQGIYTLVIESNNNIAYNKVAISR